MTYRLTPPTIAYSLGDETPWSLMTGQRGEAIVEFTDGRYDTRVVVDTEEASLSRYWLGGRTHLVDDETAALLTTAGYGSCLTLL